MSVSRRAILKGAATLSAAASLPAFAARRLTKIVIFDSRLAESLSFAKGVNAAKLIDIAAEDARNWAALRGDLTDAHNIQGLTGWSDWVLARGLLEERGFRLVSETLVPAPLSGKAHLFTWKMRA